MASGSQHADSFVSECLIKCAHVIVQARVFPPVAPGTPTSGKPNRWFLTEVPEVQDIRAFLDPSRSDLTTPIEVEVYFGAAGRQEHVLLERWRLQFDRAGSSGRGQPHISPPPAHARLAASNSSSSGGSAGAARLAGDDGALYKRLTLMVRCLCSHMRVLPVHRLIRSLRRQPLPASRTAVRLVRGSAQLWCGSLSASGAQPPVPPGGVPPHELRGGWTPRPAAVGTSGEFRMGVDHVTGQAVSVLEEAVAGCPTLPTPVPVIIHDYMDTSVTRQASSGTSHTTTPTGRSLPSSSGAAQPHAHTHHTWSRQPSGSHRGAHAAAPLHTQGSVGGGGGTSAAHTGALQRQGSGLSRHASVSGQGVGVNEGQGAASPAVGVGVGVSSARPSPPVSGQQHPGSSVPVTSSLTGANRAFGSGGQASTPSGSLITRTPWGRPPLSGAANLATTPPTARTPQQQQGTPTDTVTPRDSVTVSATASRPVSAFQGAGALVHSIAAEGTLLQGDGTTADAARLGQGQAMAASAAQPAGVGKGGALQGSTAPMSIPGSSSQARTRSMVDIAHVVYNFPENLPPVGSSAHNRDTHTRQGAKGRVTGGDGAAECGSGVHAHTASGLASSGLLHPGHGSAPAAPRGMLGQALEAHLARQAQRTLDSAHHAQHHPLAPTNTHTTNTAAHGTPTGGDSTGVGTGTGGAAGSVGGGQGGGTTHTHVTHLARASSGGTGGSSVGRDPHHGSSGRSVFASGAMAPLMVTHSHSHSVSPYHTHHTPEEGVVGRSSSSAWRGPHTPNSPQLPFAFTPSAQSLSNASYSHLHASRHGGFLTGMSSGASPSANSSIHHTHQRTHHYHHHAQQQQHAHTYTPAHGQTGPRKEAAGSVNSSTVISGRDVSVLALARRPSWVEHSARVGRFGGGASSSVSPATASGQDTVAHSLPTARTDTRLPHSVTSGSHVGRAGSANTPPQYGWPGQTSGPSSSTNTNTPHHAVPPQAPTQTLPQGQAYPAGVSAGPAMASQAVSPSPPLTARSTLWDVDLSQLDSLPQLHVTVPGEPLSSAQYGCGGAAGSRLPWAGSEGVCGDVGLCEGECDPDEDLPFLLDPLGPSERGWGAWVTALLPRAADNTVTPPPAATAAATAATPRAQTVSVSKGGSVGARVGQVPVSVSEREVAVGVLLSRLAAATGPIASAGGAQATPQGDQGVGGVGHQGVGEQATVVPHGSMKGPLTCGAALEQLESLGAMFSLKHVQGAMG